MLTEKHTRSKMRKLFFWLVFFPLCLSAQTDESDTLKLKASLSVTGSWQMGNVNTIIFRTKADITYRPWEKWKFNTKNSYLYQEFGKKKADEDILSLNFLSYNPDSRFFPLLIGIVSSNYRRKIGVRYLLGGGLTFKAIDKEDDWLKFSLSCEYENTNFRENTFNFDEYNGLRSINTARSTLWVNSQSQLFEDKLILSLEAYFQPSLLDENNFRRQADLSVELPITNHLNFKINYLHTYEQIVIEDQRQEDRILTFGLNFKSYQTN